MWRSEETLSVWVPGPDELWQIDLVGRHLFQGHLLTLNFAYFCAGFYVLFCFKATLI